MEPTVFVDVDPRMRIAQEEIFGPWFQSFPATPGTRHHIANGIEYGLSSRSTQRCEQGFFRHARPLRWHHLQINAPTIGAEVHLPLAESKPLATAIAKAASARLIFTASGKPSNVDYSDKLQKAQIDRD